MHCDLSERDERDKYICMMLFHFFLVVAIGSSTAKERNRVLQTSNIKRSTHSCFLYCDFKIYQKISISYDFLIKIDKEYYKYLFGNCILYIIFVFSSNCGCKVQRIKCSKFWLSFCVCCVVPPFKNDTGN